MTTYTRYEIANEPKQQRFAEVMQDRCHVQLVLPDNYRGEKNTVRKSGVKEVMLKEVKDVVM